MRKNFWKSLLVFGVMGSLMFTTVACSDIDRNAIGESSSEDEGYEPCTISISWWGNDARKESTEEAIAKFEQAYPGITVETKSAEWDGWENKMEADFNSGAEADVNQANWNWLTEYDTENTVFLDLNAYRGVIDLSTVDEKYLKMCMSEDRLKGVPISMTGRLFFWDKTTFDEVGCKIPTTYEELLACGTAFEAYDKDYYPLALGGYDRMILMVYYLESVYGKDWVTDGVMNYSRDEIKEGLTFIQSLEKAHVIPEIDDKNADSFDKNPNWVDGHYAGIFEWDTAASKFAEAAVGREIVVGDYLTDFGKYQGGFAKVAMCWTIKAKTAHPKEAALLVNYLLNNSESARTLGSTRGIPCSTSAFEASKDAFDTRTVEANTKVLSWVSNTLDPSFEAIELKENPDGVYYDVMIGLSQGKNTVEDATQLLIEGVEAVLPQEKRNGYGIAP